MHPDIIISKIAAHKDQTVTLKGWLANKRGSGKIQFLMLRDGTGIIQCVAGKQDVSEAAFELAQSLSMESAIEVTGVVKEDVRSPLGFELHCKDVKLISRAEEYPIQKKEHGDA